MTGLGASELGFHDAQRLASRKYYLAILLWKLDLTEFGESIDKGKLHRQRT